MKIDWEAVETANGNLCGDFATGRMIAAIATTTLKIRAKRAACMARGGAESCLQLAGLQERLSYAI